MTSRTSRSQRSRGAWSIKKRSTSRSECSGNFLDFSFCASLFAFRLPLALPVEGRVRVDEVLEGEAVVDELFDLVDALPRDVTAHARAVVRHLVDPTPVRIVLFVRLDRVDA